MLVFGADGSVSTVNRAGMSHHAIREQVLRDHETAKAAAALWVKRNKGKQTVCKGVFFRMARASMMTDISFDRKMMNLQIPSLPCLTTRSSLM